MLVLALDAIVSSQTHDSLVRSASHGDSAAMDVLLERHLPALVAYVRLHADPLIRRNESCADIAQSVCREVLEDLPGFDYRGEPAFRKWLFQQALSKLINRKRYYLREKRDAARERRLSRVEAQTKLEGLYARLCSPSEGAIASETAERLERAFDQLPDDYRQVITLARIIGMGHAEIAEEMGRQEGAVRVLLHRALARLGRLMHEDAQREA